MTAIVFALFLYALVSSSVFMTYREAAGIWKHDRVRPFVEAGLNLVLNILFVNIFGVVGVLLSTIITVGIIRMIWGSYYLFKEYFTEESYSKYLVSQLIYFCVTVGIGVITYLICNCVNIEGIIGFAVKGIISASVALILYVLAFFKTNEFKGIVGLIKGMIKR